MVRLIIVLCLIMSMLLAGVSALAQEPYDPEAELGIVRLIGTPEFVVSLLPDGALHYYAIRKNSSGFLVGVTPPGWRNDTLSPRLVDRVSRATLTAELYNQGGGTYQAILYFEGSVVEQGEFAGAGPVGSGVIVRTDNRTAQTIPFPNTAPTSNLTPVVTTSGPATLRDNGASARASGTFDGTFYTVAAGDNLYRIALRFNTTFSALMRVNNIPNPNLIYTGQKIRIP